MEKAKKQAKMDQASQLPVDLKAWVHAWVVDLAGINMDTRFYLFSISVLE